MVTKNKQNSQMLTIEEAVETLSGIAEMEFPKDAALANSEEISSQNNMVTLSAAQRLKREDLENTQQLIKDTFRVVLKYLKEFYDKKYRNDADIEARERVKTIMVLAGEAAKKLDRYTTIFQKAKGHSVTAVREYRRLQEFYLTRIARRIDDSVLSKWILELTKDALARRDREIVQTEPKKISALHVFIDLESVKRDTDYELFLLRKEDGTRFFNPRLIRNIKLVCDFGVSLSGERQDDPFDNIRLWQDRAMCAAAKDILSMLGTSLDRYIHEARRSYRQELAGDLNKAVIALMMSSNTKNLLGNRPVKCCIEYFQDFLLFLRFALKSDEYQRALVYPPKKHDSLAYLELDVIHSLCRALFVGVQEYREILQVFEQIFHNAIANMSHEHVVAAKASRTIWSQLAATNGAMSKLMKLHPNGPLVKILEILESDSQHPFDPIQQYNIPNRLYSIYNQDHRIVNVRSPSPIYQESIDHTQILEEFKAFLRGNAAENYHNKYLIINFQDRTSWKEISRCKALEDIQEVKELGKYLTVVTLSKDTEFYNQLPPYENDKNAETFMKHFEINLRDENCGNYFPDKIKDQLFPEFVHKIMRAIHKIFFGSKNVLTKENRQDFIEIFYLILQLKLIDIVRPEIFSFMCKDGIDVGSTASAELYAFLKLIHAESFTDEDVERLNLILYTTPILVRERILIPERFNRMLNVLKKIESTRNEFGPAAFEKIMQQAFGAFFKSPIFKSTSV